MFRDTVPLNDCYWRSAAEKDYCFQALLVDLGLLVGHCKTLG